MCRIHHCHSCLISTNVESLGSKDRAMRIAIVGSGYVGLVSGACLAQFGHDVICIDKVGDKIARLRKGDIPIH